MPRLYKEDLIVYAKWVRRLINIHCTNDWGELKGDLSIGHHERMAGNEVDFTIRCGKTKIIIELKETDLFKALSQAITRHGYADYVYVAIDLPVYAILRALKGLTEEEAKMVFENGIGIVSAYDNVIIFKAYSRNKTQYSRDYEGLLQWIPEHEEEDKEVV